MPETAAFVIHAMVIGIGATAFMDLWAALQRRLFGVPPLNYAMIGRWLGHLSRRRFAHESIAAASSVRGEMCIGWLAHYAIGVIFAALLLAITDAGWARQPTPVPALMVGLVTLVAPFFVMQPSMGAGVAASKTPNPNVARLRSVIAHTAFGFGLYISALVSAALMGP